MFKNAGGRVRVRVRVREREFKHLCVLGMHCFFEITFHSLGFVFPVLTDEFETGVDLTFVS